MNPYIFSGLPESKKKFVMNGIKECDPERIINAVCETLNLTEDLLTGTCRKREYTEPRQIAIGLILKANPKMTLKEVGQLFNRDHSTIIYTRELYNDLMETDRSFQKKVALVKQRV